MKNILQYLVFIIVLGFSQSIISDDPDEMFIGKWAFDKDPVGSVDIKPDHTYEEYISKNHVITGTWVFKNKDLIIKVNDFIYDKQKIQISQQELKYKDIRVVDDLLFFTNHKNEIVTMQRRSKTDINVTNTSKAHKAILVINAE